jgi:hypothetical protein
VRFARKDRTRTGMFATRDASWHAHPDVRSVKRFHAVCVDGNAACSASIVIDESIEMPARDVGGFSRVCPRRACVNEWRRAVSTDGLP